MYRHLEGPISYFFRMSSGTEVVPSYSPPSFWQVFLLGVLSGSQVITTLLFPLIRISGAISLQARQA